MINSSSMIEVSDSWKKKFDILEKMSAGNGLKTYFDNYKSLSFGERFKGVISN